LRRNRRDCVKLFSTLGGTSWKTTIQGVFYMQNIKTASDKFWRDVNGMMATEAFLVLLFMIGFGSFAYYFLFHYSANSELWDTITQIWNMIYAVYNGEAMDGMSEALGQEALSEKIKE
jgi:hypothetical protein